MTMSAEINEKRSRRRRAADDNTQVVETDTEVIDSNMEAARGITPKKGRPTLGRRNRVQIEEPEGNVVTRPISGIQEYVQGVSEELGKVSWPNGEEVRRLTFIVLFVTVAASVILGLISLGFTILFQQGLQNPVIFFVFGVIAAALVFLGNRYFKRGSETTNYSSRL